MSSHALKDMYMLTYETIKKAVSIIVPSDFINPVIAIHVFLKAIPLFTSASNIYDRINFQSESCLVVAY